MPSTSISHRQANETAELAKKFGVMVENVAKNAAPVKAKAISGIEWGIENIRDKIEKLTSELKTEEGRLSETKAKIESIRALERSKSAKMAELSNLKACIASIEETRPLLAALAAALDAFGEYYEFLLENRSDSKLHDDLHQLVIEKPNSEEGLHGLLPGKGFSHLVAGLKSLKRNNPNVKNESLISFAKVAVSDLSMFYHLLSEARLDIMSHRLLLSRSETKKFIVQEEQPWQKEVLLEAPKEISRILGLEEGTLTATLKLGAKTVSFSGLYISEAELRKSIRLWVGTESQMAIIDDAFDKVLKQTSQFLQKRAREAHKMMKRGGQRTLNAYSAALHCFDQARIEIGRGISDIENSLLATDPPLNKAGEAPGDLEDVMYALSKSVDAKVVSIASLDRKLKELELKKEALKAFDLVSWARRIPGNAEAAVRKRRNSFVMHAMTHSRKPNELLMEIDGMAKDAQRVVAEVKGSEIYSALRAFEDGHKLKPRDIIALAELHKSSGVKFSEDLALAIVHMKLTALGKKTNGFRMVDAFDGNDLGKMTKLRVDADVPADDKGTPRVFSMYESGLPKDQLRKQK